VEKAFGIRFPDDYRAFVKSHRGGSPSPQEIRISGRRGPGVFSNATQLVPDDDDYILENHDWSKDRLAPGVLPIASDPAGNYICFDFRGTGRPHARVVGARRQCTEEIPPDRKIFHRAAGLSLRRGVSRNSAVFTGGDYRGVLAFKPFEFRDELDQHEVK
jgi:hypothetical protein